MTNFGQFCKYTAILFFSLGLSITINAQTDPLEPCSTDFSYLFIQFSPLSFEEESENTPLVPLEHVISIQADEQVGFILPDNATVTLYSNSEDYVSVYAVRPEATPSAYGYINASSAVATSSATPEQNIFNDQFNQITANTPILSCDSTLLRATRPINVLGGRSLTQIEQIQRTNTTASSQIEETRRSQLSDADFFTHELIIVSHDPITTPPPIAGSALLRFNESATRTLSFQLIHLSEAPVDIAIPTLSGDTPYLLISDRVTTVEVYLLNDGNKVVASTNTTASREDFLFIQAISPTDFFTLLRDERATIYPTQAMKETYDPRGYLTVSSTPLSDAEALLRAFNCNRIVPLEGSNPLSYIANKLNRAIDASGPYQIGAINARGELSASVNTAIVTIEHWLVRCE